MSAPCGPSSKSRKRSSANDSVVSWYSRPSASSASSASIRASSRDCVRGQTSRTDGVDQCRDEAEDKALIKRTVKKKALKVEGKQLVAGKPPEGVVSVVMAALTVAAYGPTHLHPRQWAALRRLWAQLEFWANCLIFVLAFR